jgi:hypothetical protein
MYHHLVKNTEKLLKNCIIILIFKKLYKTLHTCIVQSRKFGNHEKQKSNLRLIRTDLYRHLGHICQ